LHTLYTLNTIDNLHYTLEDIENYIARIRPKLVILESYKMFMSFFKEIDQSGQPNNHSVLVIVNKLKNWREKYGITVLLTNHTNKGTRGQNAHADQLYGPSALFDYADHIFLLRKAREPRQRLVIMDKSRHREEGIIGVNLIGINSNSDNTEITIDLIEADVNESEYTSSSTSSPRYSAETIAKAQELCRSGKSTREIGEELGAHHATVARWIKKLENAKDPF